MWDLSGIPCPHAIATIVHINDNSDNYVHSYYHVETTKKAYALGFEPLNAERQWEITDYTPFLPPRQRRLPGRPRKSRRKEAHEKKNKNEMRVSKVRVKITCSLCKQHRHNKATCKDKVTTLNNALQSSQTTAQNNITSGPSNITSASVQSNNTTTKKKNAPQNKHTTLRNNSATQTSTNTSTNNNNPTSNITNVIPTKQNMAAKQNTTTKRNETEKGNTVSTIWRPTKVGRFENYECGMGVYHGPDGGKFVKWIRLIQGGYVLAVY